MSAAGGQGGPGLSLRQALALGLMHGPTELLPVSSAGHTTLVPWLAGWPYAALDGEVRKTFEVALHAGTAAALLRRPPSGEAFGRAALGGTNGLGANGLWADGLWADGLGANELGANGLGFMAGAVLPAAVAGYTLGEAIERRLGTPRTIAVGLVAGSLAIAWGEMSARRRGAARRAEEAGIGDGLVLGVAQALALGPGISRSGAVFAAARLRGFAALDADRLSWRAGLPVIGGATLLQAGRLRRREAPSGTHARAAVGAAGAFASTLAATRLLGPRRRSAAMGPACVYRVALACLVFARARRPAPSGRA